MTSTVEDYSRIIRYTSSDGKMVVLVISAIHTFGADIKTHTYTDDDGLIVFNALPNQVIAPIFSESKSLKTIVLPDSITYIGSGAFKFCTSLESIEFGGGEIYFGEGILTSCTSLKKMIFHGLNPSISADDIGASSFDDINSSGISVYYPTEDATYITKVIDHLDKPATADVNNFFPVTLVSGTTTVIGKELYERCVSSGENNIDLPGTVTVDGNNVAYVEYYPDVGTDVYFIAGIQQYVLMEDGTLEIGM